MTGMVLLKGSSAGYYLVTESNDASAYFRVSFIDEKVHVDTITLDQNQFLKVIRVQRDITVPPYIQKINNAPQIID